MNTPKNFRNILQKYYDEHGREFRWREPEADGSFDPYKIFVSEIMLQQTQTSRVEPYYVRFLSKFPTLHHLSSSSLQDVLEVWQGLGYNRRARYLRDAAMMVQEVYEGKIPNTLAELESLPGVGKNTAGAIMAYAYNAPEIFIETNIRTVYIHEFFNDQAGMVNDNTIRVMLSKTLDRSNPREFYWALMDYGVHLKNVGLSKNSRSAHYKKQSKFEGSTRQLRGKVLRLLSTKAMPANEIEIALDDSRTSRVLSSLQADKLIDEKDGIFFIAS